MQAISFYISAGCSEGLAESVLGGSVSIRSDIGYGSTLTRDSFVMIEVLSRANTRNFTDDTHIPPLSFLPSTFE